MYPEWVAPFLASLRRQGVIAQAARDAGIGYGAVFALKDRDADFAAAWDDALEESYDTLEAEALHRALHGTPEPVVYQGQLTPVWERDGAGKVVLDDEGNAVQARNHDGSLQYLTINKKSDALLMFTLKGRRKKTYAERTEVTGANGGPVQMDDTARSARIAQIMAAAEQRAAFGDIA